MAALGERIGDDGQLRACISDLISIQALPAVWSGGPPSAVVDTLLDALLEVLGLAFISLRLRESFGGVPIEASRIAADSNILADEREIGDALAYRLERQPPALRSHTRILIGNEEFSAIFYPLGIQGELGLLAVASQRMDFPTPAEKLLLNLATNQATIGLHEAANLIEQRRIASELDREVTRRTNELVKVNEELRKEIADRKRSEEQLRQSEAYLAQAQRLSLTGSFGWTPSSGEIHWSDESFRIFELDRSIKPTVEFVVQRVHPEDRALVRQAIDETSRGENDFDLTLRLLMPDGSVKYVHVLSHAVKDAAGNLEVVGALTDVTEWRRSELESSRLAAIVSSSTDAIISKTLDGQVTSWNAGAATIFGYEAHEMIGQPVTRIIPPELREEEMWILARVRQGERLRHYETVRVAKDGRRIDVALTVSPLVSKSGKVVGASTVARDITAAKRAEAELQQTRTELARVSRVTTLGELTAAIAHEVNQPLTGLVSSGNACLYWLAAETPNLEAAKRAVERMINDGTRAGEVISRIRAMVKKSSPQREALKINDTINEVMALVRTEIHRNKISPQVKLSNDLPPVWGDRIQLQQVVLNLIMNAIEAMSEIDQAQRKLSISSVKDGPDGLLVAVGDSGTGLDESSLDRLFDAFYTTKPEGMGMGLAVSQTIIQRHGGRLWAAHNVPQGAIFQFRLPAGSEQTS
jgi:PAS domain S-box-containing protein